MTIIVTLDHREYKTDAPIDKIRERIDHGIMFSAHTREDHTSYDEVHVVLNPAAVLYIYEARRG